MPFQKYSVIKNSVFAKWDKTCGLKNSNLFIHQYECQIIGPNKIKDTKLHVFHFHCRFYSSPSHIEDSSCVKIKGICFILSMDTV